MKKFEIPYNFCKQGLEDMLKYENYDDIQIMWGVDWIDSVYLPAFCEDSQTTRLELKIHPLEWFEYVDHISYIQDKGLSPDVLLQGDKKIDIDTIGKYIDLGIDKFIVKEDANAKLIKDNFPNAMTTASITKMLTVEELKDKDLSMYDRIVLDFRLNDLDVVKSLPKNHKYVFHIKIFHHFLK